MERGAALPDRCVKSNEPCEGRLKRALRWHHPAIFLALIINILIYAILASIMSHRETIHIGLSDEWRRKRRRAITIGWVAALGGLGMFVGGFATEEPLLPILIVVGLVTLVGGMLFGMYASQMVSAKRIDKTHVWVRGVCPEFLATLPPWTGG